MYKHNGKVIARQAIYNKCGGRCGYCGTELNGKFQIDHIIPESIFLAFVGAQLGSRMCSMIPSFLRHLTFVDVNHIDNLMPACASCNNYKSTFGLELFRSELSKIVERLNNHNTTYRIAKRFGTIEETQKPIVFYFEKINAYVR